MEHDDDGPGGPRRQRSVMATDSEWARITERAAAAGMSISAFICHRAGGSDRMPAGTTAEESFARLERIETAVLTLTEIEHGRRDKPEEKEAREAALKVASADRLERIETLALTLTEIERMRLAERDEEEGWEAALRRVKLQLRAGRTLSGGQA